VKLMCETDEIEFSCKMTWCVTPQLATHRGRLSLTAAGCRRAAHGDECLLPSTY
jgi:hypothetical protein